MGGFGRAGMVQATNVHSPVVNVLLLMLLLRSELSLFLLFPRAPAKGSS